jgi:hypothetical protein
MLREYGVHVTATEAVRPVDGGQRYAWPVIVEALQTHRLPAAGA